MLKRKFVFDLQRFAGVVATVKLGNADEKSFTGIKKAFKAINEQAKGGGENGDN